MGLQWTLIASFLYFEIGVCILLWVPFISPLTWRKLFKSRLLSLLSTYSHIYIRLFMIALLVAFLDSIWQLQKYSAAIERMDIPPGVAGVAQAQHLNLFRAQRNFYISGFSLFLWMVLNRIVSLISSQAQLMNDLEATRRQAVSANEAAQRYLDEAASRAGSGDGPTTDDDDNDNVANKQKEDNDRTLTVLREQLLLAEERLQETRMELKCIKADSLAMKSQSEATKREYDRLLAEHSALQEKLDGGESNKKDN